MRPPPGEGNESEGEKMTTVSANPTTLDLTARKTSAEVYMPYIGGEWVDGDWEQTYDNCDPANRSVTWGKVPECSPQDVAEATAHASSAFNAWRFSTGDFRTKAAYRLTAMLKDNEDFFVGVMTKEMGKSFFDSRLDFIEAVGVCEAVAPQGTSIKGVTYQKLTPGLSMESRLAPRGVAAIITPFNFPLAIPLAQVLSAIISGCTVVWKPSHLVPECSQAICALIECALAQEAEATGLELPAGILNLVHGDAQTGDALIREPAVQTISFTGSKAVGDRVDSTASGLGKRVMKEVAGINFFYVHEDADIERAARNFVYGKTITSGQRCSSIQEALVDSKVEPEFTARVLELAPGVVHGPGGSEEITAADTDADSWSCPPLVSEDQRDRLAALVESSIEHGAELLYQAQLPDGLAQNGNYFPFTLLTGVDENNPLYSQEAFGPAGVIRAVEDMREAIELINSRIGIVACIDSRDKSATENFIEQVLRTRIDDGRHGTGCFFGTKFGGDRGAGSGNPALDEDMVNGYLIWKTIYRSYDELPPAN
mgnify:FL=1